MTIGSTVWSTLSNMPAIIRQDLGDGVTLRKQRSPLSSPQMPMAMWLSHSSPSSQPPLSVSTLFPQQGCFLLGLRCLVHRYPFQQMSRLR